MASFEFKTHRVLELPVTLEPYSIYYVAPAETPEYVEIYISSADGLTARRVINKEDIRTLVLEEIAGSNEIHVYDTIADLTNSDITKSKFAFVIDASSDETVTSGGASYVYNTSTTTWVKTSESESMDLILSWSNIVGKPNSTPAQIDEAINAKHIHDNSAEVAKVGEDVNGNLTYDGVLVVDESINTSSFTASFNAALAATKPTVL